MLGSIPTVGNDPDTFEVLNGHPNKIPTDKILGGVVQNCQMVKIGPSCLGDSNLDEISFLAAGNLAFPPQSLFSGSESCQIEVDLLASGFRASVPGCQ